MTKEEKRIEAYVKKHWKTAISIKRKVYLRKSDSKPVEYVSYTSKRNGCYYSASTLSELYLKLYSVLQEEPDKGMILGCDGADLETMKSYLAKYHHKSINRIKCSNCQDGFTYSTTYYHAGKNGKTSYVRVSNRDKDKVIQAMYDLYQRGEAVIFERRMGRPKGSSRKKDLSLAKDFSEIPELKIIPEEADVPVSSEGNNISLTINKNGQSITVTGNNFGEIKNLLNNIASALALMEENK